MNIKIFKTMELASSAASEMVVEQLIKKPASVLGVATGASPKQLYGNLAVAKQAQPELFATTKLFALDEFVGMPTTDPDSYNYFVHQHLVVPLGLRSDQFSAPNGAAADPHLEAENYERAIKAAGGIDLQILGLGLDGHIGFNQPGSSLASRTRVHRLSEFTVNETARTFPEGKSVPEWVITMGIGTILEAKRILLLAFGKKKAEILARSTEGPISALTPATSLQLHPDVTVFCDEAAAGLLQLRGYYRSI